MSSLVFAVSWSEAFRYVDSPANSPLNKSGLFGRFARRKPPLSKKSMTAWFIFAKLHLNKTQDFWNNVVWTHETKVQMFDRSAQRHVWRKANRAHLLPTVKNSGGGVRVCAGFAATVF